LKTTINLQMCKMTITCYENKKIKMFIDLFGGYKPSNSVNFQAPTLKFCT